MTLLQSIILGIIQGATEFIPVSSSGHLVLIPSLFNWDIPEQEAFIFNVFVQVATLVAVIGFYWKDLLEIAKGFLGVAKKTQTLGDENVRLGMYIILATIPAGVFGLLLNDRIEDAFASPKATALFLFGTAGLLIIAERVGKREVQSAGGMRWQDAVWIGFFQVLALFPGISRSGATITGGMLRGLGRRASARFSFLIAVPIMTAAGAKALLDLIQSPSAIINPLPLLAGCLTAAIVGYLSIRWLLHFLSHRSYYFFAGYCVLFGALNLLVLYAS